VGVEVSPVRNMRQHEGQEEGDDDCVIIGEGPRCISIASIVVENDKSRRGNRMRPRSSSWIELDN